MSAIDNAVALEHAWLQRLGEALPGWFVYASSRTPRWRAVPAPVGTSLAEARELPNMVGADTPAKLLTLARERYGWDDHCDTCGMLARKCGHRQPEREGARS